MISGWKNPEIRTDQFARMERGQEWQPVIENVVRPHLIKNLPMPQVQAGPTPETTTVASVHTAPGVLTRTDCFLFHRLLPVLQGEGSRKQAA